MRNYNAVTIYQRRPDRYMDATAMCKANGRLWADYWRLETTKEFVAELSSVMGIPITGMVQTRQGGIPEQQGTWVHPRLAIHLAQWCSPRFAVVVSGWLEELLTTGAVSLSPIDILKQQVRLMEEQERRCTQASEDASRALQIAEAVQEHQLQDRHSSDEAHRLARAAMDVHSSNYGFYSVLAWCSLKGYPCDHKLASIHGRKLSKICRAAGRATSSVKDARWGAVNTYPEDVLERYFQETDDR
jgi:hypothetical protein